MEMQYSYKIQGQKVDMDQTIDLFDFGVKVPPVTPPPASQTPDLAKLANAAKP